MQLEKRNLEGTLRSIDKIEDVVFKVQTLVDLAEYVSRDQNYKKEADYLLDLALTATDAFLKNQPVIITFPNSPANSNTTKTITKPITKPTKTITRPTLSETTESKPIDDPPKITIDEDLENYLLLDPKPNTTADKTDKIENVEPKPDDKPSPTERARTNEIIDDNNSGLPSDTNLLNNKPATAPSTTDKPKKPAIADVEVDPDVESSLIVPPRTKKERPPLFVPDSRPTLDDSTPNDVTEKNRTISPTIQPPTITQRSKDGSTIKLQDTTIMSFDEYKKLNQPTPPAAENKTDTTKNPTESLKTPDQENDQSQPKKKPSRPKRKPLDPSN
jgi:hypothetical protein